MKPGKNEIKEERVSDLLIWTCKGDVTYQTKPVLEEAYRRQESHPSSKILFNFESEAYFNSEGLKVLIDLMLKAKALNQHVALSGLSDHFKKIFNMVGITKLAKLYDSFESALEAILGPDWELTRGKDGE